MQMLAGLNSVDFSGILFWCLLPAVIFGRGKWAVLAWLAMTNLDATGPHVASNVNIGWINAVKSLVLPLWLLWRVRAIDSPLWKSIPSMLWIALTAYASVAVLWSPYKLAALKMAGNMAGIILIIVVLERCARTGWIDATVIKGFAVFTLAIGFFQTLTFAGAIFGYDGAGKPIRFTSFVAAQQYAALLVALLAAVLWVKPISQLQRYVLAGLLMIGLVYNGSRTWFAGALVVLIVHAWPSFRRAVAYAVFVFAVLALSVLARNNFQIPSLDSLIQTDSRIAATVAKVVTGPDSSGQTEVQNLGFRLSMYRGLLDGMRSSTVLEILGGHGTSSGGIIANKVFPRAYPADRLDPNRVIHNEWLRVLYEWGVIGSLLWCAAFLGMVVGTVRVYRMRTQKAEAAALLSYLPALTLALSTENILAGAGSAVTIGFCVLEALLFSSSARELELNAAPAVNL